VAAPVPTRDPDILASHVEDAAHFSGGHAEALFAPASEAEVAYILRTSRAVLPIGAQSSLTGGATPFGEALLTTTRLNRIGPIGRDSVRVQAGVTLAELDAALTEAGRYYPPSPTFTGASVGGAVSTNAAGAATFKYGTTREWVQALTVVLPGGDVLDIERGAVHAHPEGYFDLDLADRRLRVPLPTYRMPHVPKLSAGYFARPGMDLIDLFIGAEGTLGVVTAATLRVLPVRPAFCLVFLTFADRPTAWSFVGRLREAALATWRSRDPAGIDVSSIEHIDARCLSLLREDGLDRHLHVGLSDAVMGVLVTLELPPDTTAGDVYDQIGRTGDPRSPDTSLARFCVLLAEHGVLDRADVAAPGDRTRTAQLHSLRESVPVAVNQRVGLAKVRADPRIEKTAADVVVPFERLESLVAFCEAEGHRRGLDLAVWGHLSDGNIHPNVIPRTMDDVEKGREAMLDIGREAMRLGGAPLAEHGVGRNRTKQQLLIELYGEKGIDEMRRVKAALDPEDTLSPGVIFRAR
jgi:D-lactate dehydrogenase (cytochrome)